MKKEIVVVIPAYNPNEKLIEVVKDLKNNEYENIVVVNDGSKDLDIFNKIEKDVIILNHEENKGYGRAIKTGIKYAEENFKDTKGVINVDADGQHVIEDINNLYSKFIENPQSLIIGSRILKRKNVPFKSKIGNMIMTKILEKKTKRKIEDTQTGLRIIPKKYLKDFLKIKGERYEFTIQIIIYCIKNNIKILEVPIQSIYFDNNKKSSFRLIKDSLIVYKAIKKAF